MPYDGGHDLDGSAQNVEFTIDKMMPIILWLKLHFTIWVIIMKAHIVSRH